VPGDSDSILKKFEGLAKRLDELERENKELREENQRLRQENDLYRQKIDKLIRHRFGRRSEMLDSKQLELLLKGLERQEAPPSAVLKTPRRPPQRKSQQPRLALNDENLPVEELIIEPPEVLDDPEGWTRISEERTSQLDWVPAQVIKRVYIRPRYVRKERFAIAKLPPQPIDKGMVGAGLLSHILINKYDYHQPLYRQADQPQDHGLLDGTVRGAAQAGVSPEGAPAGRGGLSSDR